MTVAEMIAPAAASKPRATAAPVGPAPSPEVIELLGRLPSDMLRHTAEDYPHVVEAPARDWASPARMHRTLDALMFDTRGGRQGFPLRVLAELATLRTRYARWVGPAPGGGA
jgi:hypothetical protein